MDDTDCDGWTESQESYLGTDPVDDCPNNTSHAAWPPDMDNNKTITVVGDVLRFVGHIGANPSSPNFRRLDLNADGFIGVVGDVLIYRGKIGARCA
jgi:hypothetical protein